MTLFQVLTGQLLKISMPNDSKIATDTSRMRTVCRHCHPLSLNSKSYASVLVTGGTDSLSTTLTDLESRIIPCVSAVCPECEKISILSDGSTESVLCTVFMWQRMRQWIDTAHG